MPVALPSVDTNITFVDTNELKLAQQNIEKASLPPKSDGGIVIVSVLVKLQELFFTPTPLPLTLSAVL